MFDVIYYNNDTVVRVVEVRNASTNQYINNATVQVLGIKEYGATSDIAGSFPIALAYVAGSNGVYTGVIPSTLPLVANKKYVCRIQVLTPAPSSVKGYWEFSFTCRLRQD